MELASALAEISSPVIPIPFPFHQPRRAKKAATTQSYGATASFRSKRTAGQEKEIINLITPKQKQWGTNSNHQSKMGEKNAEAKNPNQQQQNHTHTQKGEQQKFARRGGNRARIRERIRKTPSALALLRCELAWENTRRRARGPRARRRRRWGEAAQNREKATRKPTK
jgi:hypothetical protein